jgi:CPA1 family monovalent cation:H+ antiporter
VSLSTPALVFWMLLAITLFAIVSRVVRVPYPIVMLTGGGLIALIPGVRPVMLAPDVVFLVILPLLLFGGGWTTDFSRFKQFLVPILWLALGLVVLTTLAVAHVAHAWLGLPLASAYVLGAILSPSDAIATEAIAEEIPFPAGAQTILSGESLVNDAAALVLYAFAVKAVSTGTFSLAPAALDFVYVTIAGMAIGIVAAYAVYRISGWMQRAKLQDDVLSVLVSLVTPFMTYLPAQAAQASGVLAAVTGGVFLSTRSNTIFTAEQRIAAGGVWSTITFALNGFAFILVGLQLRSVFGELAAYRPATLLAYALGIAAVIVGVRFVATFVVGSIRWSRRKAAGEDVGPHPPWGGFFITGWAGMRGIVTLAGALAIPATTASGAPFPGRALILFLAFTTIVITLVGQGLTLPFIVRRLGGGEDDGYQRDLAFARLKLAEAGRERLRELETGFTSTSEWEAVSRLIGTLDQQVSQAKAVLEGAPGDGESTAAASAQATLSSALHAAKRTALEAMRRKGEIGDRAYRQAQYEIDLAESGLQQNA